MKNILILGATSAIAQEMISYIPDHMNLYLAGRDLEKLNGVSKGHPSKNVRVLILTDFENPEFQPHKTFSHLKGEIDCIISFVGHMRDDNQMSIQNVEDVHTINFLNPVKTVLFFVPELQKKKEGQIVFISSVAGERGRKKNFVYGSAKGALTVFSSGLRAALSDDGIQVTTILLGLVDTPMTQGMKSPLISSRTTVAKKIFDAIQEKKDIAYIPFYWRWIMCVIKSIPEKMFKKLSF